MSLTNVFLNQDFKDFISLQTQEEGFSLKKASDIPSMFTNLAKLLSLGSLFEIENQKCKIISLEGSTKVMIWEIMNANSKDILGDNLSWDIFAYDRTKNDDFLNPNKNWNHIILLGLHNEDSICSLEKLKQSYHQVWDSIIDDWKSTELKNNEAIFVRENEKEFALFVKHSDLKKEAILINHLASLFLMKNDLICSNKWTEQGCCYKNKIYIWVRKSKIQQVVEVLGLNLLDDI